MHYLVGIAQNLIRNSFFSPRKRYGILSVATARDLLILAEAEIRLSSMTKSADPSPPLPQDLDGLFDELKNTGRDLESLLKGIAIMEEDGLPTPPAEVAREISEKANEKLAKLASLADVVGDVRLADEIDDLLIQMI